ncbi:hypothetical protein CS542_05945 [Pedobacter sp. IW39]|nr:hypothetical protein CS542_05945 [Pedobacter sp. IW39]
MIGDLMLDHYIIGSASRLSRSTCTYCKCQKENKIIGGAANVASNLIDLVRRYPLPVLLDDSFGEEIKAILQTKTLILS